MTGRVRVSSEVARMTELGHRQVMERMGEGPASVFTILWSEAWLTYPLVVLVSV